MVTSTQLTDLCMRSGDPLAAEQKIWNNTRYLVAQVPAASEIRKTFPGYYEGRVVIPGPKADPTVSETLTTNDLQLLKSRYHIRFVDNATTDNADESVRQANYTVMSAVEADDYEAQLRKQINDRSQTVPSEAA